MTTIPITHREWLRWRAKHTPDLIEIYRTGEPVTRNFWGEAIAERVTTLEGDAAAAVSLDDLQALYEAADVVNIDVEAPCGDSRSWFRIRKQTLDPSYMYANLKWKPPLICPGRVCMPELQQ